MKPRLQHLLLAALSLSTAFAAERDGPRTAISKLADEGELLCRPALPYFCENVHVACSGRTTLKTFPFKLKVADGRGAIEVEFESTLDPSGLEGLFQDGSVDWGADGSDVILRPRGRAGFVRVLPNGNYSFRHYEHAVAAMSYGRCE